MVSIKIRIHFFVALCALFLQSHSVFAMEEFFQRANVQLNNLNYQVGQLRPQVQNLVQQCNQQTQQSIQNVENAWNQRILATEDQRNLKALEFEKKKIKLQEEHRKKTEKEELELKRKMLELEGENAIFVRNATHELDMEQKKQEIEIKAERGILAQEIQANKEMLIETSKQKWASYERMFGSFGAGFERLTSDPARMAKIVAAIAATGIALYGAKHFMPVLVAYLIQPRVVSETSKKSWFGWKRPRADVSVNNLTFAPELQHQLRDLAAQVKTAKEFDENLPNVLFWGAPGTGKTAFAKALAYESGLQYALTSGSEFAKITDLNVANSELRKLLEWGQHDKNGLIIFIDEAESLFANRKLPTTSKQVQDFINTFLALVPEKSQKNLMFIFATNHPFKLDDAITNRVGASIEFVLPGAAEREEILSTYLEQFARANPDAEIFFDLNMREQIPSYAAILEGLAPRAIKFVAEQMIIRARRQDNKILTGEIALSALNEAKKSQEQVVAWEKERETWLHEQLSMAKK